MDWAAGPLTCTLGRLRWSGATKYPNRLGALFSFLYFKKNQNFKNICPFWKISKLPPGRPMGGRQALDVIFFFKFATRSIDEKNERGGPVAPPTGDRVPPPISPGRHSPAFSLSFEPKNSGKKRGVRRRKAAKLCRIPHLWSTGNFRMNPLILYNNLI